MLTSESPILKRVRLKMKRNSDITLSTLDKKSLK